MTDRKAKLEKALGVVTAEWLSYEDAAGNTIEVESAITVEELRARQLKQALIDAVEALEELQLGHSHESGDDHIRLLGDNYGWCSFCQTKVSFGPGIAEEALSKIDKALGEI